MSHLNINGVDKPLDHIRLNNVRSENLLDYNVLFGDNPDRTTDYFIYYKIVLDPNTQYTMITNVPNRYDDKPYLFGTKNVMSSANDAVYPNKPKTITSNSDGSVFIACRIVPPDGTRWATKESFDSGSNYIMLNLGSTALPYQPYLINKEAWEARTRVILHNLTNPLCGIGTYKDTLDLSTGTLTRYVKKLVLTGEESGWLNQYTATLFELDFEDVTILGVESVSSHYIFNPIQSGIASGLTNGEYTLKYFSDGTIIFIKDQRYTTIESWKSYLAAQYAAGNPITVWYVLETPETEQITVPSNLTGIVEGYLTQSSTPSPTSPVYPTANGTLEQGGTYSLDTGAYAIAWGRADTFTGTNSMSARCYGLPIKSWEIDGNSQQTGTPTPDAPIMPEFVGNRTENLFDKNSMVVGYYLAKATGVYTATTGESRSVLVKVEPSTTYTITGTSWTKRIALFDNMPQNGDTPNYYSDNDTTAYEETSFTFMTLPTTQYLVFFNYSGSTEYPYNKTLNNVMSSVMLNTGSTPLPYEPYGWAIEIEVT